MTNRRFAHKINPLSTEMLAPREVMVAFRETARVRIRMGEIMALKPLGMQAMASLKVMTRRATR